MKKMLFGVLCLFILSSCSKDDESIDLNINLIYGIWELQDVNKRFVRFNKDNTRQSSEKVKDLDKSEKLKFSIKDDIIIYEIDSMWPYKIITLNKDYLDIQSAEEILGTMPILKYKKIN